jgi:hypothetical protein
MTSADAKCWFIDNHGPSTMVIDGTRRLACGMPMAGKVERGPGKTGRPPLNRIEQLDRKGNRITVYADAVEAFAWTAVPPNEILDVCEAGGGRIGKHLWRYAS